MLDISDSIKQRPRKLLWMLSQLDIGLGTAHMLFRQKLKYHMQNNGGTRTEEIVIIDYAIPSGLTDLSKRILLMWRM